MQIPYTLVQNNGQWAVKAKPDAGGAHGGGAMPGGPAQMPPGHPPAGGAAGTAKQ